MKGGFSTTGVATATGNQGFTFTEGHCALVSTPGVAARVHTDTTFTDDDPGVPRRRVTVTFDAPLDSVFAPFELTAARPAEGGRPRRRPRARRS